DSIARAEEGRRRFAYDELLGLGLAVAIERESIRRSRRRRSLRVDSALERRIRARLPFAPTAAQERATADIRKDLGSAGPMNRLIQGDVGSGKTAVAAYAILAAVGNRLQAALMAPTEVLAEQHARTLSRWLEGSRVRLSMISGGLTREQRDARIAAAAR